MTEPDRYQQPTHERPSSWPPDALGWWLSGIPALSALLLPLAPSRGHGVAICAAAIALSAYLVKRDATQFGKAHPAWSFSMILLPIALPIYVAARQGWGAPFRLPFAVVAVIGLTVSVFFQGRLLPLARVTVSCQLASDAPKDGYICTAEHVGGFQDARACWDLTALCQSGTRITEHACAHAVVRQKREGRVPFEYSVDIDECDEIQEALVENLRVELPSGDALSR